MRALALSLALVGAWIAVPVAAASRPGDRTDVVVHLRGDATAAGVRKVLESAPGAIPGVRLPLVDAFALRATPAQIRALAARADVESVEPDRAATTLDASSAAGFGVARAKVDIPGLDGDADGAPAAYSKDDLVAAVIDTGIDASHPDLDGGKVIAFKDLVNGQAEPYDDQVHGTWVAGILAGSGATGEDGRGVAPGAALVGVKVIDRFGQGSLSGIAAGIQWVVEHEDDYGIDVINLSIGDPRYCGGGEDVASQAVDAAVAAGIVVVAAAGNNGPGPCTVADPAAAAGAIALGAMADPGAGGFHLWSGSSRGPTADGRVKPELVGPGVDMTGPFAGTDGTVEASGTSAAAPFTAGAVLLMLDAIPRLTPVQVRQHLVETAEDWGAPGQDHEYGYGRLDAYAALHRAGAAVATPPRVPGHQGFSGTLDAGGTADHQIELGDTGAPLAATVIGSADVDLDLVAPAGAVVERGSRQESLRLQDPPPGTYTLRVRAASAEASYRLDVSGDFAPRDASPPALTLDAPRAATRDPTPRLAGDAGSAVGDFPGVVVRIRREGDLVQVLRALPSAGRWSADAAPLADGAYTASATQGDAAGNATTPPPLPFTVDTAPPETSIGSGPPAGSTARTASFSFASPDAAAFECRLDEGAWAPCPSPFELTGLPAGSHRLDVVAVDAAGNRDPSPAAWRWVVEPEPEPTATPTPTVVPATPRPEPTITPPPAGVTPRSIAASAGRVRSGGVGDLAARDGRSVLIAGAGRAGLTAVFARTLGQPLSIQYRARSSGACRHRLAAWSRKRGRWIALLARSGRSTAAKVRLPAAVDRSKPLKIRATCTRRGAAVRLRVDVLRGVRS